MNKTSQCKAELITKCVGFMADLGCKYYKESLEVPLKCAYRFEGECLCPEAVREAARTILDCHVSITAI